MQNLIPVAPLILGLAGFTASSLAYQQSLLKSRFESPKKNIDSSLNGYPLVASLSLIPAGISFSMLRKKGPVYWQINNRMARVAVNVILKPMSAFIISQSIFTPTRNSILYSEERALNSLKVNSILMYDIDGDYVKELMTTDMGIGRITRYPVSWGVTLWCLANVINRATPVSLLVNAFCPLMAFGSSLYGDKFIKGFTAANDDELNAAYFRRTSIIPFGAIRDGLNSWELAQKEIRWVAGETVYLVTIIYCMLFS